MQGQAPPPGADGGQLVTDEAQKKALLAGHPDLAQQAGLLNPTKVSIIIIITVIIVIIVVSSKPALCVCNLLIQRGGLLGGRCRHGARDRGWVKEREGGCLEWVDGDCVREKDRERERRREGEGEREEDRSESVKICLSRCAVKSQGQEAQAVLPQRANDLRVGAGPRRGSSTSPLPLSFILLLALHLRL